MPGPDLRWRCQNLTSGGGRRVQRHCPSAEPLKWSSEPPMGLSEPPRASVHPPNESAPPPMGAAEQPKGSAKTADPPRSSRLLLHSITHQGSRPTWMYSLSLITATARDFNRERAGPPPRVNRLASNRTGHSIWVCKNAGPPTGAPPAHARVRVARRQGPRPPPRATQARDLQHNTRAPRAWRQGEHSSKRVHRFGLVLPSLVTPRRANQTATLPTL